MTIDNFSLGVLRRLHRDLGYGPDRECRWYYEEIPKPRYWCQHLEVQGSVVSDTWFGQFEKQDQNA